MPRQTRRLKPRQYRRSAGPKRKISLRYAEKLLRRGIGIPVKNISASVFEMLTNRGFKVIENSGKKVLVTGTTYRLRLYESQGYAPLKILSKKIENELRGRGWVNAKIMGVDCLVVAQKMTGIINAETGFKTLKSILPRDSPYQAKLRREIDRSRRDSN